MITVTRKKHPEQINLYISVVHFIENNRESCGEKYHPENAAAIGISKQKIWTRPEKKLFIFLFLLSF